MKGNIEDGRETVKKKKVNEGRTRPEELKGHRADAWRKRNSYQTRKAEGDSVD